MMRKLLFFGVFAVLESGLVWAQNLKVHTIGDSTMADYMENTTRTRGWGEMLQEFFSKEVQVINYARGGRSSRSFWEEGRWDKVKENISPGDYEECSSSKKVPVVDMTALTKEFVEDLGADATNQQIYVPTDGTSYASYRSSLLCKNSSS